MTDVVVLVGAGSIGRAVARRVSSGRSILVADLRPDAAESAAEALRNDGFVVETAQADVSSAESVAALADRAAAMGDVTHVIHAAGVSPVQASTRAVIDVDLVGTALVLEEFGRVIAPGGSGIVISSQAGHMGDPLPTDQAAALAQTPARELASLEFLSAIPNSSVAYIVAKRANILRAQAAAPAWGDRGARVNSISPGIIMTPLARDELDGPAAAGYRAMIETSAAGRVGTPDEIGDVAAFMMATPFLTGTDLLVDGGVVAAMAAGRVALGGDYAE
ncbi:MAG: SDR family oxidoreductase [Actinomycetaceae bacterium]|nr:SDR family oxidoreductase [Actinomycetaceae bacterium]